MFTGRFAEREICICFDSLRVIYNGLHGHYLYIWLCHKLSISMTNYVIRKLSWYNYLMIGNNRQPEVPIFWHINEVMGWLVSIERNAELLNFNCNRRWLANQNGMSVGGNVRALRRASGLRKTQTRLVQWCWFSEPFLMERTHNGLINRQYTYRPSIFLPKLDV